MLPIRAKLIQPKRLVNAADLSRPSIAKSVKSESEPKIKREGFWSSDTEPDLPVPVAQEKPWEGKQRFLSRLKKVEARAAGQAFKGWSTCRCCGCRNGSVTFQYKRWSWPSGFIHYIDKHNVEPTEAFKAFVNSFFAKADEQKAREPEAPLVEIGTIRMSKKIKQLKERVIATTSFPDWLSVVHDYLNAPQHVVATAVPGTTKVGWKLDRSSAVNALYFVPGTTDPLFTDKAKTGLAKWLTHFESNGQPIVYSTGDTVDTRIMRTLVVSRELVSVSRGADAVSTHEWALRITPIFANYGLLNGSKSGLM